MSTDDIVMVDFSQAPTAIKITALATVLGGFASIIVGVILLLTEAQNDNINSALLGIGLVPVGIVMVIAGLGLYRLWKPAWILYVCVSIGLLFILVIAAGIDKILIILLIIFVSLILGDLLAENEYFLRPDKRSNKTVSLSPPKKAKPRKSHTLSSEELSEEEKPQSPKPKNEPKKTSSVVGGGMDDYFGEGVDEEEDYDMLDMIQDETYDEDEWDRREE